MTETLSSASTLSDDDKDEDLESDEEEASPLPTDSAQTRGSVDETDQIEQLQVNLTDVPID